MKISGADPSVDDFQPHSSVPPSPQACKSVSDIGSVSDDSAASSSEDPKAPDLADFELEESELGEFLMDTFDEGIDSFPEVPSLTAV